ncbi:MAG: MotA/TolQ/ExbB proton channel family protein [Lachnospiraceae bacterium]|nr:MotA/TolQ/ExbB proton channel family protein [Lachnospiraceae bacterium]MCD7765192.1 MotA/TolQ/ExbB proton channel family protein [Lachnospiraceae bacterium]
MYIRRFISVLTAVLAVGVCVFITYISRDVEITSLAVNLGFLAVMLIAILASLFTGMLRLMRISKALSKAAETIRVSGADDRQPPQKGFFGERFLDDCYSQYCEMSEKHPDGSCDLADFINEDSIETYIHRSLLELIPDILASLGILGTFIGLVLGLRSFDPSGYEQMADSVSPLIDGIKVAFVTSIYGLALSLPFSFNLRSELSDMSDHLDDFMDTFYLYVRPSREVDAASRLMEQTKSHEEITDEMTRIVAEQMAKSFEATITPAFLQMTDSIRQIVDTFSQSQADSVSKICDAIISDIHTDMDDSFHKLNQSAKQLERTQSAYTDFMDRSMSRLQKMFGDLQSQVEKSEQYNEQTLGKLTQAQKDAFRINEEQTATYQEYIRFMYQTIENFSDVWEANNQKLQGYTDEIAKMGPVQSNTEILDELAALSAQLEDIRRRQAADTALSSEQEKTEQMLDEITKKLDHLEKLAAQPVLFRRKNKG